MVLPQTARERRQAAIVCSVQAKGAEIDRLLAVELGAR